ncbi:hypothetical protein ACRE_006510 [Hapsidospora chrysogenum ATCC 11550]|uniref:Uncharacterized protein n=1 Tax=Hapsidospora chrysogenum (strain ATCC 11550 / CBS 779.69 / DSM 880 / IAM 14645 / JCM 23072 / IMI 49137) TaxID=857340 RepID=A0A086TGA0_HAPC1|nr:hypothetical protein ACRE_006510 [Hapsidospora chrysogenum ATCC 11550]
MRASSFFQLASLSPLALGLVVPKDVTPEQLDELIARDVDAPENPRLDIGKDGCFRVEKVDEREEFKECEPKKFLEEDGTCKVHASENECESYCETSLKWFYGEEVPFHNGRCGKGPCTLEDRMGAEVSKTTTWGLQIGHGAFTLGASFAYTEGKAIVSGVVRQKPEDLKESCGYWTFIPYMIESCGISAKGDYSQNAFTGRKCSDVEQKEECYAKVLESPDGAVAGHVAFVATECDDYNDRLPFCKQDPIYLKAGVSFDEEVNAHWVEAHFDMDLDKEVLGTAQYMCEQGEWPPVYDE